MLRTQKREGTKVARWVLTAALMLVAVSCGSSDSVAASAPTNNTGGTTSGSGSSGASGASAILVVDDAYQPALDTVVVGTTITWAWGGNNYSQHSVTFSDGQSSPTQSTGTYARTFDTAGTYNYQCLVHGAAMTGTIVVK